MTRVFVTEGKRTAMGAFGGRHAARTAIELAVDAVAALPLDGVEEVVLGNVVSAGLGQAPARQVAIGAGLPATTPAYAVDRVCASGLQAILLAGRGLRDGGRAVAVGAESMSRAPFLDDAARFGRKFGDAALRDALHWDGLRDFLDGSAMGVAADRLAAAQGYSREECDAWAAESVARARAAAARRAAEIVGDEDDEPLARCLPEKLARLRPAFSPDGVTTPGNASPLTDGAAAVLLATEPEDGSAEILGWASESGPPGEFVARPVDAIRRLLAAHDLRPADVDLFEINEAFAVGALHAAWALELDSARVNAEGGAVALGHPLGASGVRLVLTLRRQLIARGGGLGVACACVGGGEAVAVLLRV